MDSKMEGADGGVVGGAGGSRPVLEQQQQGSQLGSDGGASMNTDLLVKMLVENMRENCRFEFEKKSAGIVEENKRLQVQARKAEAKSVRLLRQNKRLRGIVQLLEGELKEAQDKLQEVKISMGMIDEAKSQVMGMDMDGNSQGPEGAATAHEEPSSTSVWDWRASPQKDPLGDLEAHSVPGGTASPVGTRLWGGKGQFQTPPRASLTSSVTSKSVENESSVSEPVSLDEVKNEDDKQKDQDNLRQNISNGGGANNVSVSNLPPMVMMPPPRSPSPKLLNGGLLNITIPAHPQPQLKLLQKRSKAMGKPRRKVENPEGVMDLSPISLACIDDLIYGGNRDRALLGMRPSPTWNLKGRQGRHRRRRWSGCKSPSCLAKEEVILVHMEDPSRGATEDGFFCICGGESFSSRVNLRQHVRYYNNAWKFNCIACGSLFYSLGHLRIHLRKQHQRSLPPGVMGCTRCGQCFPSSRDLTIHRRAVGCGGRMRRGERANANANVRNLSVIPSPKRLNEDLNKSQSQCKEKE